MSSALSDYVIAASITLSNVTLLSFAWRQRSRHNLAFFLAYVFFETINYPLLFVLQMLWLHHLIPLWWYGWPYFISLFVECALQVAVVYQLFHELFKPYQVLPERAFRVFLAGCAAILIVCTIVAFSQPAHFSTRGAALSVDMLLSFNLLQCVTCFFIVAFASSLGLPMRHIIVGIALGLALTSLGTLAIMAITARLGQSSYRVIYHIPDLVYLCSALIWIDYFRRAESVRLIPHPQMLGLLQKMKRILDSIFSFATSRP